jgi:hypothetical protein
MGKSLPLNVDTGSAEVVIVTHTSHYGMVKRQSDLGNLAVQKKGTLKLPRLRVLDRSRAM